jgi:hypothetical protein
VNAGGSYTAYPLAQTAANAFTANFPDVNCGQTVRYYIGATLSNGGPVVDPATAPTLFYSAPVLTNATTIVAESFEGAATGWTTSADASVTAGQWALGVPIGTANAGAQASPSTDATPGSGTKAYVTGLGAAGGTAASQDLDGGPVRLTSPVLNLAGFSSVTASMAVWYYCDDTTTTPTQADKLRIEVTNGGGTWVLMEEISANLQWAVRTYTIENFVALTNTVQIRMVATDNPNNSVTEAGLDEFVVSAAECVSAPACPADINDDGMVDSGDLGTLLSAWGTAKADLDGDGATDSTDLGILLSGWGSCP